MASASELASVILAPEHEGEVQCSSGNRESRPGGVPTCSRKFDLVIYQQAKDSVFARCQSCLGKLMEYTGRRHLY